MTTCVSPSLSYFSLSPCLSLFSYLAFSFSQYLFHSSYLHPKKSAQSHVKIETVLVQKSPKTTRLFFPFLQQLFIGFNMKETMLKIGYTIVTILILQRVIGMFPNFVSFQRSWVFSLREILDTPRATQISKEYDTEREIFRI